MAKDWKHAMSVTANHLLAQCVREAVQNGCGELELTVIVSHADIIAMATTIEPPQQAALVPRAERCRRRRGERPCHRRGKLAA